MYLAVWAGWAVCRRSVRGGRGRRRPGPGRGRPGRLRHGRSGRRRRCAGRARCDVPGVHLVRAAGRQLRLDGGGVGGLRAPFPAFAGLAQHPVIGGYRAEVGAFIQQRRPDFVGGQVSEPVAVQHDQDRAGQDRCDADTAADGVASSCWSGHRGARSFCLSCWPRPPWRSPVVVRRLRCSFARYPPVCAELELGGAVAPQALGSSARLEGRTAFPQAQASQVRVCRRDVAKGKAVRRRPG
jgi:hypothetical protein